MTEKWSACKDKKAYLVIEVALKIKYQITGIVLMHLFAIKTHITEYSSFNSNM